jgi:hypothetical protein
VAGFGGGDRNDVRINRKKMENASEENKQPHVPEPHSGRTATVVSTEACART